MNEQQYFIMYLSFTIERVKKAHYIVRVYNRVNKKSI